MAHEQLTSCTLLLDLLYAIETVSADVTNNLCVQSKLGHQLSNCAMATPHRGCVCFVMFSSFLVESIYVVTC